MAHCLIQIRPDPTCKVPHVIALRRLLKCLLRQYGFVATDIREVPAECPADASEVPAHVTHTTPTPTLEANRP